eukprot:5258497-Ditylum_brightwellii.AAC.1
MLRKRHSKSAVNLVSADIAKYESSGMTYWSSKSTSKIENRTHNNDPSFDKSYEQFIVACNPTSSSQGE